MFVAFEIPNWVDSIVNCRDLLDFELHTYFDYSNLELVGSHNLVLAMDNCYIIDNLVFHLEDFDLDTGNYLLCVNDWI